MESLRFRLSKNPGDASKGRSPSTFNPQPAACTQARSGRIPLPISIYGRKNRLSSSISGWKAIFTVNLMQSNEKLLLQIFIRRLSKILF